MSISEMISEQKLQERIAELGGQIKADYNGKEITLIGSLKGGVMFMVDLSKHLDPATTEFEFVEASSYGDAKESSGEVKLSKGLSGKLEGKHVLIVEDIIDTGLTLGFLIDHLKTFKPASIKICVMLNKPEKRAIKNIDVDYIGFDIANEFVVGYGLDYKGKYRNLRYIGSVK